MNGFLLPPQAEHPPYRLAAAVAAFVLTGYVLTLAPTVTLWDAGEFVTAAYTLGIPHPPGTPFFVMVGHVWGAVVAVGGYAWRLNLLSAVCSAAGAGFVFLAAHRALAGETPLLRTLGGAAAAVIAAFTFTVWQNSNETEVYAIAMFMIGAMLWLAVRWRDTRSPRYLLLIVYVSALSIGNHLLALLVGPAVSVFVAFTIRSAPATEPSARRVAWAEWAVVTAMWALLVAVGLGNEVFVWIAAVLVAAALAFAWFARSALFGAAVVVAAMVGVSTYAFLYVRAGLGPVLNEADPSTWQNLLAVIQRAQYPPRTPLDNPTFQHGPDNPGRTIALIGQQLVNYFQYFDWQWSRAIGLGVPAGPTPRLVFTSVFILLGVTGLAELRRRDTGAFALLGTLWLATGLGLVAYMNFKPGFSIFWEQYATIDQHEVRERDYFFIASFQAWAVFAGLGLATVARRLGAPVRRGAFAVFVLAFTPLAFNWKAASRRGPDAYVARDFAYNMLQSVGPYGVLFTYGDNDTFPLWYLQEVEAVRQDVALVNLSLANTDWYLDQMRQRPTRPFDRAAAPPLWRDVAAEPPTRPLLDIPDSVYLRLNPFRQERDAQLNVRGIPISLRAGQIVLPRDFAILFILESHLGKRPIAFGSTSAQGDWLGLNRSVVQRGLAYEIVPRPDSLAGVIRGVQGEPVDTAATRVLAVDVFRYTGLFEADTLVLDPAARQVVSAMGRPWLELAQAAILRHDQEATLHYLRRAIHLMPSLPLYDLVRRIESEGLDALTRPQQEQPARP